ncbi:MAG: GumC family protein [Desulfobacterales bacterium]
MKILRVDDFKPKKSDGETPATSQTETEAPSEESKESESSEEQTGIDSADDLSLEKSKDFADADSELIDEQRERPDSGEAPSSQGEQQPNGVQPPGGGEELQTFFMHLSQDALNPGQMRESSNLPEEKKTASSQSATDGETAAGDKAPNRVLRNIDLKSFAKFRSINRERPKRKQKDSDSTDGGMRGPIPFSMRDACQIIFKHKIQIGFVFFLVVFMAVIGTLLMKPVYEASAQLLVKLGRESVFVPTTGNVTPIFNINVEQQVYSEIEIMKSRSLAEKVVAALGPTAIYKNLAEERSGVLNYIMPDKRGEMTPDERQAANFESAVVELMKSLEVGGVRKSNVIQVDFKHEDPQMAAEVVNTLANLYLEHHLEIHKKPQNVRFFKEQTDLLKGKLDEAEERLNVLRKQYNITSLEQQRSLLLNQSSTLSSSLNDTISQEVETEKRIHQLRIQLASVPETISQGVETNENPYLINTLEARLVELQLKEKELLDKYTDESRLVRGVKEEIQVVQQKLAEQDTRRYGSKTSGVNPTYQRLKEEVLRNEAEIEALKAKKIAQQKYSSELQGKLEKLNQVELEIKQLQQEIEVDRENYRLYLTKVEESRISDAMDTEKISSVTLIGPARPPSKPVSPRVKLNILIGIFLGIFASLSLAVFREYLDDRIEKVEDVEKELQLPVLASIPIYKHKAAGLGS